MHIIASHTRHKSPESSTSLFDRQTSDRQTSDRQLADQTLKHQTLRPRPSVSIMMPVHNEESVLRQKIQLLLASDYLPAGGLFEIIIGSDASDDGTDKIISEFARTDDRIIFYRAEERTGKSGMLNILASKAKGEIIIITDANVMPSKQTVRLLAEGFTEPETGLCDAAVIPSGNTDEGIIKQENFYSRFESALKRAEGEAWGTMTGPYGGFYAVRKSIFPVLPGNLLVDDLYVGLTVLKNGFSSHNIPEATVTEDTSPGIPGQFRRRVRIAAGSFQNLYHFGPFPGKSSKASFCFFSHKVLRWFSPLLLAFVFMTTVILSAHSVLYFCLLSIQLILILLPALDMVIYNTGKTLTPLRFATQFLMMNAALAAGFVKSLKGIEKGTWEPTKRV
jgi:cellulose synthase/poly-beta-1,6-N-acetylglucosamine synthase-like glycosyltransferase